MVLTKSSLLQDANCPRCHSRYCGKSWDECRALLGTVYVKGEGYVPQPIASQFEREGLTVEWSSRGWAD